MRAQSEGEVGRVSVPTVGSMIGRAKSEAPATKQSIQSQIQQRLSSKPVQPETEIPNFNDVNTQSADGNYTASVLSALMALNHAFQN